MTPPLLLPPLEPLLLPLLEPLLLPLLEPLPLSLPLLAPPSASGLEVEFEHAANWLPAMAIERTERKRTERCMAILLG